MSRAGHGEAQRFVRSVAAHTGTECLFWPFGRDKDGYGTVRNKGQKRGAHRVVCEMVHGEAPSGEHEAAHSCGNGHLGCVNPIHLSWKTHAQNTAESSWTKLSADDVHRIRLLRGVISQREIAAHFGCVPSHISMIHAGHSRKETR